MKILSIILVFSFLALPLAQFSILRKLFNLLFPEIIVELINNATHKVHVKCRAGEMEEELLTLNMGSGISRQFREILYPLKWCYVHIDNDNKGAFWGSHVRWQCSHCYWSISCDGIYFYQDKHKKWVKQFLAPIAKFAAD